MLQIFMMYVVMFSFWQKQNFRIVNVYPRFVPLLIDQPKNSNKSVKSELYSTYLNRI